MHAEEAVSMFNFTRYHSWVYASLAFVVMTLLASSFGQVEQAPDGGSGTIKFGPPDLSDEMASSFFVPDKLKCDACRAIAYQMWTEFTKFNEQKKFYKFDLPESELLELVDTICIGDPAWKDYGMKEINRVPRLAGPGLETMEAPGVTALGGKWPGRLRDMCESFVGEVGETTIYKVFRNDPTKQRPLEDYLCHGQADSVRGTCTPRDNRKKTKEDL